MITEPKLERHRKQNYAAIRMAVPIPFGKYLQPAWDEVYNWLKSKDIKPSGPAIIRYLTTDMPEELDIDIGFTVDKTVKGNDRLIADVLPAGHYATLLYTGPYKAMASSKRPWPCEIGPRNTKSNGMSQEKRCRVVERTY